MDYDRNGILIGDRARDNVSGFTGIVTGISDYLTGCSQACLNPGVDEKGQWRESHWFDVDRLEVIEKQAVAHTVKTTRGGPPGSAPIK